MTDLKRCTRCVLPETHETILFDEEGVCNICRGQEYKQGKIDWNAKKKELDELIAAYKGKHRYDCIIPFSGGKDSTWAAYYLVKEYGLKPLVVCYDHGFMRRNLLENTKRTIRKLGVDFHVYTPNWKVVQKLMLQSFLDKGDFCWHCHTGIFAYPMWAAIRHEVPLIFWGEPSAEYTAFYSYEQPEEVDEKRFNRHTNLGISADDMYIRLGGGFDERDMQHFHYPPLKELRRINYRSVCLGSYIFWDVKRQYEIIHKELDWQGDEVENVPPGYQYEKIECCLQGVRDYIKYIKRGYTRPCHLATIDIRNNRLSRDKAMEIINAYEGKRPPSLEVFLGYIGLTREEFMEVSLSHGISPYVYDTSKESPGKKTHDFDEWPRYEAMPRAEAERLLNRWRESRK